MFINTRKFEKPKKIKVTRDRPVKSLAKAISWRIVGSLDTFILSFFLIKFINPEAEHIAVKTASSIAIVEVVTKIILYYLHERAWNHIRWGRMLVVIRRNTRWTRRSVEKTILEKA